MIARFVLLGALLSTTASAGEDCAGLGRAIEARRSEIALVENVVGALDRLAMAAAEAAKSCPDDPRLRETAARAAELVAPLLGKSASPAPGLPLTPETATIEARRDGSEAAARRALALDPAYRPARRALAVALAKAGKFDEAAALLPGNSRNGLDRLARAWMLLAVKRNSEAAREARAALSLGAPDDEELGADLELRRDANAVLGLSLPSPEGHNALRIAAELGSEAARAALRP